MQDLEEKVSGQLQLIIERFNPYIIYLFGSVARGEDRSDSDIDLAFVTHQEIDGYDCLMMASELADLYGREVDLVNLREVSTVFRAQVIGTSKVMYCTDEYARNIFEMRALKEYALLNEEREPILRRIREEGTIYGDGCYL